MQDCKQIKLSGAVSWVSDHFSMHDLKYNGKSHVVCNLCFLRNTEYADGKKIGGDCANWVISYGVSKSTSKLNNHLIIHHKEIYEAHISLKAVTAVAGGGTMDSHLVYG